MAQCIHSIEQATCGICTPRRQPDPAAEYGPWFPAGYRGECGGCGYPIEIGDDIRSDGEGGWLCCRCGSDSRSSESSTPHTIRPAGGIL